MTPTCPQCMLQSPVDIVVAIPLMVLQNLLMALQSLLRKARPGLMTLRVKFRWPSTSCSSFSVTLLHCSKLLIQIHESTNLQSGNLMDCCIVSSSIPQKCNNCGRALSLLFLQGNAQLPCEDLKGPHEEITFPDPCFPQNKKSSK